jgi:hypothetical protein
VKYSLYNLNLVSKGLYTEISTTKTKIMSFQGKEPITSKICIENAISVEVNNFNYLRSNLTSKEEIDIEKKLREIQYSIKNKKASISPCKS